MRAAGAPDDVERYFIFQTLVGAWPIERERIEAYMEKALREAKRNTNWVEQNHEWEAAVKRFCRGALLRARRSWTTSSPSPRAWPPPASAPRSAQLVLKLTAPGIPDIYQGDELPFRALVDPDNRRPVDWDWRQAMLRRLMGGSPPDAETMKLFLTLRLLGLRGAATRGVSWRRLTSRSRPARTCARSCAAARCWSWWRCAAAWSAPPS